MNDAEEQEEREGEAKEEEKETRQKDVIEKQLDLDCSILVSERDINLKKK
jgi:hypothetical protein